MLSLYFITTTGYSLTHRLGSFFWYLNIVWAYCCHSRKAETKGCLFFLLHVSFLLHLLRMSEPYLPCNHPVVERMYFFEDRLTHLHACSAIHVPSSPPSPAIHSRRFSSAAFLDCVLYLQVFFLRHASAYTSCHWQRASHPSQILRNGALLKVKSEGFFFVGRTHTRAQLSD